VYCNCDNPFESNFLARESPFGARKPGFRGINAAFAELFMIHFIKDVLKEREVIESAIKKYGYAPEHHFGWYLAQGNKSYKDVFMVLGGGEGLMTIEEKAKKKITVFSSPLAPADLRITALLELMEKVFKSKETRRIEFELEEPLYESFISQLPGNIKANKINYTLVWPVHDLSKFDPSLPGKEWKTLRKVRNTFYKSHKVEVLDTKEYKDKKSLKLIVDTWHKKRGGKDMTHRYKYHNFIDSNFMGAKEARVMMVDGKPSGINAGWMTPNSDQFYGAIGIHNYSANDLGDILYLEDLEFLKSKGYKFANMGGGEEALTNFKKKFKPSYYYKTHTFLVVKK